MRGRGTRLRRDGRPWSDPGLGGADETAVTVRRDPVTRRSVEVPEYVADDGECADLASKLQSLFDRGYTPVVSHGKKPGQKWARWGDGTPITRDELFSYGKRRILVDRCVSSLSVRLDGPLAAVDMDFADEGITEAFVRLWQREVHPFPAMVRGSKGGKIFFRLEGKEDVILTPAPPLWHSGQNALEIKTSLSAVYGRHSDGIRYRAYGNELTVFDMDPGYLPEVSASRVLDLCVMAAGLSRRGSVSALEEERAACCLLLSRRHGYETAMAFAEYVESPFMAEVLRAGWHRFGTEGPLSPRARDLASRLGPGTGPEPDSYMLFEAEIDGMDGAEGDDVLEVFANFAARRHDTEPTFTDTGEPQ